MEKSLHIRPRKRKQYYSLKTASSSPFMGRFTRSKSQVHFHQNRSGRTWTDTTSDKSIHHQNLLRISPLKKPKRIHYEIEENGAALDFSIKDLRARARRVFSPTTAVIEEENGNCGVGFDFGEENCNGSSKVLENFGDLELGTNGLDPDLGSGPGFGVADQKEENENKKSVDRGSGDPYPGMESHRAANKDDEVDLNKITSTVKEKNGFNKVSNSGMILNSLSRRKVFKSPSSFSYRRLLPFLMDMTKDDSGTSRIEIVDKDFSCKVQNLSNVDHTVSSVLIDTDNAKTEDVAQHIDDNKSLEKGDTRNVKNNLHVKEQDPHDPPKMLPQTEENVSPFVGGIANENHLARGDKLIEDCVQTTPPDATIFSEIHNHDDRANGEINILKTGNHILGHPANGSMCSNQTFLHENSHKSPRRNNTISMTKRMLNPCSRSKIFRTSSSFSYRRLLPFLMDVANSSTNIDQSPSIQKNLENNQHFSLLASSNKDAFFNKNEVDLFQEKEAKNHEPDCPITFKVYPIAGSSDDICPELSTPFSSSSSSIGKSNPASSENISQCDISNCLQEESTSTCTHVQLNKSRELEVVLPVADFRICDSETNCSIETSCSTIKDDSLPKESLLESLQHEQVYIGKNSLVEGLDNNNSKTDNIRSVSLDQYSSRIRAFSFQGTDSSVKGILKRNPRGCRGLCDCLNCAAFRLHANRAFEFSRNQMLDAEEVAVSLIDELVELRNLLETSAADGSKLGAFPFNKLQVREACQKALKTEQLAKQRLGQMNDDLNVHCRITTLQPPRVTFSRYIEEKSIPSRDLLARP